MSRRPIERNFFPDNNLNDNKGAELPKIRIPSNEYQINFSVSPGPGGQHGDKANTKVELRFNIRGSETLTDEQKNLVLNKWYNRINQAGDLILQASRERSQRQNKIAVIQRFNQMINEALDVPQERIPTTLPKKAKAKRLELKQRTSKRKASRRKVDINDYL